MKIMYDGVTLTNIATSPAPYAVGCYDDGTYRNSNEARVRFPNSIIYTFAVRASDRGHCLDIEAGDAIPVEGPGWLEREWDDGNNNAGLYSGASEMNQVLDALKKGGINWSDPKIRAKLRLLSAHYGAGEHICGPHTCGLVPIDMNGTQCVNTVGWDKSLLYDDYMNAPKPPPPPDPHHYSRFDTKVRDLGHGHSGTEIGIVTEYDQKRHHPKLHEIRLATLRHDCLMLADRIKNVVAEPNSPVGMPHGPNLWSLYWRRWRENQLMARAHNEKMF